MKPTSTRRKNGFEPARITARTAMALALAAVALAGCVSVPKLGAPAQQRNPSGLAASRSLAAPQADWPSERFWDKYGDPQLSTLIDEALRNSPTLAQAEARVRQAQALAAQARGNAAPTVTANGTVDEVKQSYNLGFPAAFVPHGYNDYGRVTLDFNWDFDFWGRNRSAIAAATSEARAAEADRAQARLVLASSIAEAYGDLGRLFAERDLAQAAVDVRLRSLDLVRQRVANGLDSLAEQRQAEAQVPSAREALAAVDEEIGLTRNRIAALLGEGPDRGLSITRPAAQPQAPFGLPSDIPANLLGRRPDVAAARWRAEAATRRVGVAKADFYPNVNLAAFIGFEALGLNKLFASGSDVGRAGPAISLPIFDAGRIRARYAGARAEADVAVESYNATLTEALHEVADAATSEKALTGRLADARQSLAASEDAYRLAQLRYQGKLSNYLSVLEAEDRVLAGRRTVAELQARAFTLDIALARALGGGFSDAPSHSSTIGTK